MMTDYALDVVNDVLRRANDQQGPICKLYIKIDKNGNVDIKCQTIDRCNGRPDQYLKIYDLLIINDNIHIPDYIIDMLRKLLPSTACHYTGLYMEHYENVIESIRMLKVLLRDLARNPQNTSDIKMQLECEIRKNSILEKEIIRMEKEITDMESKIKNIQTLYLNILNDNEKLKKENSELYETIVKFKYGQNYRPNEKFIDCPIDYTQSKNLSDCWSNPGGASVYTKSNGSCTMVYNEDTGIYEPGYN